MTIYLNGPIDSGRHDFTNDDVVIGNLNVNLNVNGTSVNDNITQIPPAYPSVSNGFQDLTRYRWIEILTTGTITVTGVLNLDGRGFIGGNGGGSNGNPARVYGNVGRGGYLDEQINGDPLNEKTLGEVLNLSIPPNSTQERVRNAVYPGSGGRGGRGGSNGGGGGAGGGCGGGFARLIADQGITITSSGRISCRGLRDGRNGFNGTFNRQSNINCNVSGCKGTVLSCSRPSWTSSWTTGSNGEGGRALGSSTRGNNASCCSGFVYGTRCWSQCGCRYWATDPLCSGTTCSGGGCCCRNIFTATYSSNCVSGGDGHGGGGGGLLLRSYGPIEFTPENIDLRGYNGTAHGGTLKIFHSGLLSNGILDPLDNTRAKPTNQLKVRIGGFYNELIYSGYCPDPDSVKVQSLTSVATTYQSGQEQFNLKFSEGQAYVPNGLEVSHGGYEIYRAIDDGSPTFVVDNGSSPPPDTHASWALIDTIPYSSSSVLGPQGISNPFNNQTAQDDLGRVWIYKDGTGGGEVPAWYLDLTAAQNAGTYFTADYNDTKIYSYLTTVAGLSFNQATQLVQDILFAKKSIWYRIKPVFTVGSATLSPDCPDNAVHPETTDPEMNLFLFADASTPYEFSPPSIDGRIPNSNSSRPDKYYDDQRISFENTASGFDDLLVRLSSPTYWGSFQFTGWAVDWDYFDTSVTPLNFNTASVSANTPRRNESTVNRFFTYEDPTKIGRNSYTPTIQDPLGYKVVSLTATYNENAYNRTTGNQTIQLSGEAKIFEREPTPVFHLSAIDAPTPLRPESKPAGDNGIFKYFTVNLDVDSFYFRRIVSGYSDGINVNFYDESIARTFPISSWTIDYDRFNGDIATTVLSEGFTFADQQKRRPSTGVYDVTALSSQTYNQPGVYYPTLTVRASTSNTSFDLSAINRVYVFPPQPTANFINLFSSNMETVSGYVPIFFKATDTSIGNLSHSISSWDWEIYDDFDRTFLSDTTSFFTSGNVLEHNWKWHTDNLELSNITVDSSLNNVCLNVSTSGYGWRGFLGQAGIDGLRFPDDFPLFSRDKECKHIFLYERPPVAALTSINAFTYASSFRDDDPDFEEFPAFIGSLYVSGYAPYLAVTFQDISIPKSYPISGYTWNFDDYYNEEFNLVNVNLPLNSPSTGWEYPFPEDHGPDGDDNYPAWITDETGHTVEHVFTLPGIYNVTLFAKASSTSTTRFANMTVEVIENPPTCGFEASLDKINWTTESLEVSGEAPLTVYFNPSGVKSGSFPIGRLIWDFGDGTEPFVIDRYVDNYNNQPFGSDPRGFNGGIIEHVYERRFVSDPSTFTARLSVVSDRSNTTVECSGIVIGPVRLPTFTKDGDMMHLIKNRSLELKNDNLYVLQRKSDKSVYNIVLSAG